MKKKKSRQAAQRAGIVMTHAAANVNVGHEYPPGGLPTPGVMVTYDNRAYHKNR